jgi:ABC-type transport system involved in multi-copper enzyme maturation permease subunit
MTTVIDKPRAAAAPHAAQAAWLPGRRLLGAEFLKLGRRRGLMIAAAVLSVGAVLAFLAVAGGLHLSSPHRYAPPGGTDGLRHVVFLLSELAAVVAILVGASAGAGDVSAGVFRNLVSTGRSRAALFLARIPAGLVISVVLTLIAYGVGVAAAFGLAGRLPVPSGSLVLAGAGWVALSAAMSYLLGLGLATLIRSRSITIAVLLGLTLVVTPIAGEVTALPAVRQALPGVALLQLQPAGLGGGPVPGVTYSAAVIGLVLVAWAVAALAAGLWRTVTQDA